MKVPALLPLLLALFLSRLPALEPASERIVVLLSVDGLAHYYMDDRQAEMPNIRRLASEGVRAQQMKAVMPTVTWPNHTSIVTGVPPAKHGVIGNDFLDRATGEVVHLIWDPVLDKEQIVKVPTIYDVAKKAGLKTAAVTWPGSRSAKALDWTVPCVNNSALFVQHSTPSLLEEFKQKGIPYENEADGFKPGQGENRDRLHVRMFNFIVNKHRPQLALLHILQVDHVEHQYGPQSPEAYAAVKFADSLVGEVWENLKKAFPGKATLVLVSDHGFFPYRQTIRPNVALREAGLLTVREGKITDSQVRAVSQGGSSLLYITDTTHRDALLSRLASLFQGMEGIALVLQPKDFSKYGLADPVQMPRMCDVVLAARKGYMFNDAVFGAEVVGAPDAQTRGAHGYDPNESMMHATFVAWGVGIKAGANLGTIENLSVAPTLACLLNLKMENTDGKPLDSILAQ